MEINLQTKVGDLLDEYPSLEPILLELSPAFSKLRNPILRRTVAKAVSLQQAAGVAKISPAHMVQVLRKAAGLSESAEIESDTQSAEIESDTEADEPPPEWFDESKVSVRFDATAIIDSGGSPMQDILKLANQLQRGAILELTSPFKPAPLMDILRSKAFKIWYGKGKTYISS